ncbi:hypothetical protein J6590_098041 [Homalodisca vitripennis]|nr:hypothetical protein J6590_098041 [Homalodisca vitripennis]
MKKFQAITIKSVIAVKRSRACPCRDHDCLMIFIEFRGHDCLMIFIEFRGHDCLMIFIEFRGHDCLMIFIEIRREMDLISQTRPQEFRSLSVPQSDLRRWINGRIKEA